MRFGYGIAAGTGEPAGGGGSGGDCRACGAARLVHDVSQCSRDPQVEEQHGLHEHLSLPQGFTP